MADTGHGRLVTCSALVLRRAYVKEAGPVVRPFCCTEVQPRSDKSLEATPPFEAARDVRFSPPLLINPCLAGGGGVCCGEDGRGRLLVY